MWHANTTRRFPDDNITDKATATPYGDEVLRDSIRLDLDRGEGRVLADQRADEARDKTHANVIALVSKQAPKNNLLITQIAYLALIGRQILPSNLADVFVDTADKRGATIRWTNAVIP